MIDLQEVREIIATGGSLTPEFQLELVKEIERLERMVNGKPDFTPPLPGEGIQIFQRLWEACIGLSEKADFKAVFNYTWSLEKELRKLKEGKP